MTMLDPQQPVLHEMIAPTLAQDPPMAFDVCSGQVAVVLCHDAAVESAEIAFACRVHCAIGRGTLVVI